MSVDFEGLYNTYKQELFSYLLGLTGDRDAAEELLAETFFRAFVGINAFRGESSPGTWLFSIARHVFYQYLRKNKRAVPTEDETLEQLCVQSGMIQRDAAEASGLSELVRRLLEKKDERSRKVFRMRLMGYSFREIAGEVGISENSARVLDHRTRLFLRTELKKEGYGND